MIFKAIKKRVSGWRPLVLHWRRRRVLRPILKQERVLSRVSPSISSSVSISYFPQIHLHFTTHVRNHNHQSAVHRMVSATKIYRQRLLRERRLETRIKADKEPRFPVACGPSLINYINVNTFSNHLSLYSSSNQSALIPNQIERRPASAALKIRSQLLVHTRVAELNNVLKTKLHLREQEHRQQLLSFRSAQHETLVNTSRTRVHRAEELVWRDVSQTTNQQSPVGTPAVSSTHAQTASSSSTQTTPQQITKLDPALVDRLTDDVIRRVEKRARIERQRRGL